MKIELKKGRSAFLDAEGFKEVGHGGVYVFKDSATIFASLILIR